MACTEYGWSPWPDISFVSRRHFSSLPASEVALDRTVVASYPVDQQGWCFLVVQLAIKKSWCFWVVAQVAHLYAMQAECRRVEVQCNAMQCNAMQARHMKAGGGEEIHSPPPVAGISRFNGREVATTWGRAATLIARGPIVVSRVYSLFVAKCTMPCYRRLDCMVEWAKADLLQAALMESLRRHCHIWITLNWRQDWWNNAIHTNYTQVFVFLL